MNVNQLAADIIREVGGKHNIKELFHCATRLRFYLKDTSVIDVERIKKLDGVLGVQFQTEQLQIIIGNEVETVYKAIISKIGFVMDEETKEKKEKMRIGGIFETISAIILPIIPVMAGTGLLKGIVTIMTSYLGFDAASGLISVMTIIADTVFYFMPFFIAYTSALRFKTNIPMALLIAGFLMYPTMTAGLANKLEPMSLLGLPIPFVKYAASSIPVMLSVFVMKHVYKWVDKIIPQLLRLVFTPLIVAIIMAPITLGITGPIANYISLIIANLFTWLFSVSPILAGAVIGSTRSLLVFTGMHLSLGAVILQNIAVTGYDVILPVNTMGTMAIFGTCLGVWFKTRKIENKSIAASATISSFLGITEPGIYGILLKYKNALIANIIAGGIAGAFVAYFGGTTNAYVNSCILSLPVFVGPGFWAVCVGMVIATVLGFIIVVIMGINETDKNVTKDNSSVSANESLEAKSENGNSTIKNVLSPLQGNLIPLSEVSDNVFSSEVLGKGIAIQPTGSELKAPFDGIVSTIIGHALGLTSNDGVECVIHVGLETVNMKEPPLEIKVKEGDVYRAGELLAYVNIDAIKNAGYDLTTPIIITNTDKFMDVLSCRKQGEIATGEELLTIIEQEAEK